MLRRTPLFGALTGVAGLALHYGSVALHYFQVVEPKPGWLRVVEVGIFVGSILAIALSAVAWSWLKLGEPVLHWRSEAGRLPEVERGWEVRQAAWTEREKELQQRLESQRPSDDEAIEEFYWERLREATPQFAKLPRVFCHAAAKGDLTRSDALKTTSCMLTYLMVGAHTAVKQFCPDAQCVLRVVEDGLDSGARQTDRWLVTVTTDVDENDERLEKYFTSLGTRLSVEKSLAGLVLRANSLLVVSDIHGRSAEDILDGLRQRDPFQRVMNEEDGASPLYHEIRKLKQCKVSGLAIAPICLSVRDDGPYPTKQRPMGVLEIISLSETERLVDKPPIRHAIATLANWAALCIQLPLHLCESVGRHEVDGGSAARGSGE